MVIGLPASMASCMLSLLSCSCCLRLRNAICYNMAFCVQLRSSAKTLAVFVRMSRMPIRLCVARLLKGFFPAGKHPATQSLSFQLRGYCAGASEQAGAGIASACRPSFNTS